MLIYTGPSTGLYQSFKPFSTEKKRSFTLKNLLTSVWLVYVLESVGASPGKFADVTGVCSGVSRLIRAIEIYHEFYAATTRSYISNRVGSCPGERG